MSNTKSTMSALNDASVSVPHLMCYFRTRNENGDKIGRESTTGKALLSQETGKKSSYLLQRKKGMSRNSTNVTDDTDWYYTPKPAHLVVEHYKHEASATESTKGCTFFFGGLQLIFSEKTIEIYLTTPGGKETYLMTCKGIPYNMNQKESGFKSSVSVQGIEWRRALCVVPGGPRCISRLRIKLIGSSSTSDSTMTMVQYMKLTARIANDSPSDARVPATVKSKESGKTLPNSNPLLFAPSTTSANLTHTSEPPLTQKDLGAAMAGLTFMARKTEENMTEMFKQQSKKIEERFQSYFARIELQMLAMKPTLVAQHQFLKENQDIIKEQQQIMDYQTTQINKLLTDNQDLKVRVQSLQAEISIFRSQAPYTNIGESNTRLNQYDVETTESTTTVKEQPSQLPSSDDVDSLSNTVDAEAKLLEIENAQLRNIIQTISQDMDRNPLLGGCGGPAMMHPGTNDDAATNLKTDALKRSKQGDKMNLHEHQFQMVASKTSDEIEATPLYGGCGAILYGIEEEIKRKIDSVVSSRIRPSNIALDKTRSIENVGSTHSEEFCNHTSNIEVALTQDEQMELEKEEADEDTVAADEKSVDDTTPTKLLDRRKEQENNKL